MQKNHNINKAATIKHMQKLLIRYQHYFNSIIFVNEYSNQRSYLQISESQDMYFEHDFTKIIKKDVLNESNMSINNPIKLTNIQKKNRLKAAYIVSGFKHLINNEQKLLEDFYIYGYTKKELCHRFGDVTISTINRRIARSILHLAIILQLEITI